VSYVNVSAALEVKFDEEDYDCNEDAENCFISITKLGANDADIQVRIHLFTVGEFEGANSNFQGSQRVANPAECEYTLLPLCNNV
jgi:hypothetical protein